MTDGDLNPRPEQFDEGWHGEERRYSKGKISAGTVVNWLVLLLVLVAVGFAIYVAAAAFVPRWWAQQVADQVGNSRVRGMLFGLGVGSVFTFVPLLVLAQARRRFFNWAWRIIVSLLAMALALPNWLTLSRTHRDQPGRRRRARDPDRRGPRLPQRQRSGRHPRSAAGDHRRRDEFAAEPAAPSGARARGRVSELEQRQAVAAHREVRHEDDVPPQAETPSGTHAADRRVLTECRRPNLSEPPPSVVGDRRFGVRSNRFDGFCDSCAVHVVCRSRIPDRVSGQVAHLVHCVLAQAARSRFARRMASVSAGVARLRNDRRRPTHRPRPQLRLARRARLRDHRTGESGRADPRGGGSRPWHH